MATKDDYPGMTQFQRDHAGKTVSGHSGIVPFARLTDGRIVTPNRATKKPGIIPK